MTTAASVLYFLGSFVVAAALVALDGRRERQRRERETLYRAAELAARSRIRALERPARELEVHDQVERVLDRHSPGARLERIRRAKHLRLVRGGWGATCD